MTMDWFISLWQKLSPDAQAVFKYVVAHLEVTIMLLTALISWLSRRQWIRIFQHFRAVRTLTKRLPDFSEQQIKRGIKYYIWPDCQSVDPCQSDEARHTVAVKNKLKEEMDRLLRKETEHKHYIVLADSGMGKTSFLLNYFALHLRRLRRPFDMALIPLGVPGLKDRIKAIPAQENTILLLDAFDEDTEAKKGHAKRLMDIMNWTRSFKRVVITCRTQFFPRDEELPKETGIIKVGPRSAGECPEFTFYKIYLSPFSDEQVQAYLKRRFSIWKKKRRLATRAIVEKIPNLAVRPMLLTYVDDLIDSEKDFESAYQIYIEMVDAWLERERQHVKDKEALRKFSSRLAVNLFANSEARGGEFIPYEEIEPFAQQFSIPLDSWDLSSRSLLNRDAEGNYKFAHRSILEFLFAQRLITNESDAMAIPIRQWTDPVRSFLFEGLGGKPGQVPLFFVHFNGGTFKLESAKKKILLSPFDMAVYPITNKEYETFDPDHERCRYSDQDDQPVVNVSWEDANDYCRWLSEQTGEQVRLPTEEEWEFAASGGGVRKYPWGNQEPTPERANYSASKIEKTTPVGSYPLGMTPEGLFDMAGNVWEWCEDWLDDEKKYRVVRGGAFSYDPVNLRCSLRYWDVPLLRDLVSGFRVVRAL